MRLSKKVKKAGVLAALIITLGAIVLLILPGMINTTVADEILPEEHLFVDATYLLKNEEKNNSVSVTCDIYITNVWGIKSGNIKIIAYVIETGKNFAVNKSEVEVGTINSDSTLGINVPLSLLNNTYKIEILIFEDDKLVIKGEVTISAYQRVIYDSINHEYVQDWDLMEKGKIFYNIKRE